MVKGIQQKYGGGEGGKQQKCSGGGGGEKQQKCSGGGGYEGNTIEIWWW